MKRLIIAVMVCLVPMLASARQRTYTSCEQGNYVVNVLGSTSTLAVGGAANGVGIVQASFPSCTVTVYLTGTQTLATIYSDSGGTPKSNPYTATSDGSGFFYADNGRYDVQISGANLPSPVTKGDILTQDLSTGTSLLATTVTYSATPTFAAGSFTLFMMTLTGNVTSSTITGSTTGEVVEFQLCQDGTGGRTFAWPGLFLRPPTIVSSANACTDASFYYDGTNWRQLALPGDSVGATSFANLMTFNAGISSSSYNNVLNAAFYSGADIGAQFNSAEASADCPSTGCEIHIPVGTGNYNFSTQLVINKTILLVCDGVGGMANGGSRQNTTLTWTGGASAAILISGSSATASKVKGCALNNTGTGTVGIDLDSGANDVQLEDIPIVLPTVPFSVAAFRVGNTGIVVNPQFKHTVARAAAPIGYDILNVQSHFVGIELRSNSSTVADMVLGKASASVQSFDCYGCIFETASGVNSVVFQRVEGAHFYGGYDEAGGVATTYPFDIPTTSTLARNISFDGMFFSCIRATCANAPVHSNFGSAMVDIQNSYVVGYGTNSLFQNDAVQRAHITGNDIFSNGAVASSFTNVDQCGNGVNSVIVACSFTGISSAGPIGTGTPAPGTFTTLTANTGLTLNASPTLSYNGSNFTVSTPVGWGSLTNPFGAFVLGLSANASASIQGTFAANRVLTVPDPLAAASFSFAQIEDCGATSGGTQACAKTVLVTPIIVKGDVLLNTATTQSITTLPFTNANYSCSGSDLTTATGIVSFNTYANASVIIQESGGVNTDHLRYTCVGN